MNWTVTDYRALCVELFGTDDTKELKKMAAKLNAKNPRNAGRGRKFTPEERNKLLKLLAGGATVNELAERFGTSRQIISKYINQPLGGGYTLRLYYMHRHSVCTVIDVDFIHRRVRIQNRTANLLHRAFGVVEQPTWEDFEDFISSRCFPQTRGRLKETLANLGLDSYDPLQIIEKTGGRTAEDNMWIRPQYAG